MCGLCGRASDAVVEGSTPMLIIRLNTDKEITMLTLSGRPKLHFKIESFYCSTAVLCDLGFKSIVNGLRVARG